MKHSLTVAICLALGVLALLAWQGEGSGLRGAALEPTPATESVGALAATPAPAAAPATRPPGEGNAVIVQAAREVGELPALEAKLRLQTNMLGQELIGSGGYYQLARAPETLFKLELKLQVANQVSSLLQISDGRFLWTRRDLPTQRFLGRVDLRRVAEALSHDAHRPLAPLSMNVLAHGGLGRLLDTLDDHFHFAPPEDESFGGVPVWVLRGEWKPEALAELWPAQATALQTRQRVNLADFPAQLPSHVVVVLSRDPALRHFPYRIDYQRGTRAGEGISLVSIDLFDVRRNAALDPRLFTYKPGDQEVVDHTEAFLHGLGL